MFHEVETYEDLLAVLQAMPPGARQQTLQVLLNSPGKNLIALHTVYAIGTVNQQETKTRGVEDNKHHPHAVVMFSDRNPFSLSGAIAHELNENGLGKPVIPPGVGSHNKTSLAVLQAITDRISSPGQMTKRSRVLQDLKVKDVDEGPALEAIERHIRKYRVEQKTIQGQIYLTITADALKVRGLIISGLML